MNFCVRCILHWKGKNKMEIRSLGQVLEESGEVVIRTSGTSMEPLLHENESTVLVRKRTAPCRKNDVVLFIRPSGQYVLHRVIRPGNNLKVQGDHQPFGEEIPQECVIGVMAGYHAHPNSPFCSLNSVRYRLYLLLLPLRRGYGMLRARAGQLYRRWKERRK